jgi:hypothetical protein
MKVIRYDFDRYDGMYPDERGDYVFGSDYDALAARLAEADAVIRKIRDFLDPDFGVGPPVPGAALATARSYLRSADSAVACQHDLLQPSPTIDVTANGKGGTCRVCNESWSLSP